MLQIFNIFTLQIVENFLVKFLSQEVEIFIFAGYAIKEFRNKRIQEFR